MKKSITVICLVAICLTAAAQEKKSSMFWGLKGGIFYDAGDTVKDNVAAKDASTLSFALKPSIGWYLNENWVIGLKGEFANSKVYQTETSTTFSNVSLRNMFSNLTLGNGLGSNYMSWKVLPYARRKICTLFTDRLNLWVELELYAGQKFTRKSTDEGGGFYKPDAIYGVSLSPMISFDLNDKFMLCLTPDLIRWDGQHMTSASQGDKNTGSFSAQFNPLYQILSGIVNISLIKRF